MAMVAVFVVLGALTHLLHDLLGPTHLLSLAVVVFVVAWIGQFIGHYFEGKRPSFFRDLRFLLIGPLWVLEKLYTALGIRS